MYKTKVIAEAGLNHNGNLKNAMKLIDIAKNAEADYVKFQIYSSKNFFNPHIKKLHNASEIFKRLNNREFNLDKWRKICSYSKRKKINIIFSVFDLPSLKLITKLNKIKEIKIPSGEITNYELLDSINSLKCKVYLSTGMSTDNEIDIALKKLKSCDVTILYCVSEYPANHINLYEITRLKKKFKKKIGFSDHSNNTIFPVIAAALGAEIIEKHFTYYKNQKIGDHKMSLNSEELKSMINNIKVFYKNYKISKKKKISTKEKKLSKLARKAVYLKKNLNKNEKVDKKDIIFLRPAIGIAAEEANKLIGKKTKKKINSFQPLNLKSFYV